MAGGTVSTILSEWLIVLLIVFSLIFEFVLHRVEHWVNHRHHHLQAVVKTLYRELMVLGVVSFTFITYELLKKPDKNTVLSFEFAHIFIFLLAIFYTIVVLSTMFASLRLSHRWKHMEQVDLVKYLHQKDLYSRLRLRIHRHRGAPWRMIQWWFPNVLTLWRYWQLHEMMAFHDIRFQFIFYRNLPEHFRFSSFLRRIKAHTFVHLVESHWSLYVIFLILVLCDIGRRELIGDPAENGKTDVLESVFIIVAAVFLMAIVQILAIKIRRVYWELTKNPRVYYAGLQAHAVAEELDAAARRRETEREKRRYSRSVDVLREDSGSIADDEATDTNDVPVQFSDTPEAEMLDPMHLQFPTRPGVQNLEGDSGNLRPDSVHPMSPPASTVGIKETGHALPSVAEVNFKRRDEQHLDVPKRVDELGPLSSLDLIASRHSLDWNIAKRRVETRSAQASLDLRRTDDPRRVTADFTPIQVEPSSPTSPPNEFSVAVEVHETAIRHSLDISRQNVGAKQTRDVVSSSKSSVAKAAVEAARKRSVENQFGRHSLDSERPGDSRRPPPERPVRDSVRRIGSPRVLSRISSRRASTEDDRPPSGSEYGRGSVEGRARQKRSIELAAAMPREELAVRHQGPEDRNAERDIESGVVNPTDGGQGTSRPKHGPRIRFYLGSQHRSTGSRGANDRQDGGDEQPGLQRNLSRNRSLGFMNASILKNVEHQQNASNTEPAMYPWIVTKLIPRLARVASPVEKLFWFGSHMFFLWCVEFTLFFSTVLLSAASASIFLIAIEKKRTVAVLNIASLLLAGIALFFVLFRIAGIIKKYIFILHNAGLVPESIAIQAIYNVNKKRPSKDDFEDGESDLSGAETEREDEQAAIERRKTLGIFFRSEAEVGNMPGIDVSDARSSSISGNRSSGRLNLRKLTLRRRKNRMRNGNSSVPSVPKGSSLDL